MEKPMRKFRWWLIEKLDPYVKACWVKMVLWAIQPNEGESLLEILRKHPQMCIDDAACGVGKCYCGKYSNKGKPGWSKGAIEDAKSRRAQIKET